MFASDQMGWPEKIGEAIDAIEQAPFLTEDQKRDILYHNAVRFLRLEEDASRTRPSREEQPWEP
jgi:predicted TIM-barrel fold metal-dependent hydrolase